MKNTVKSLKHYENNMRWEEQ